MRAETEPKALLPALARYQSGRGLNAKPVLGLAAMQAFEVRVGAGVTLDVGGTAAMFTTSDHVDRMIPSPISLRHSRSCFAEVGPAFRVPQEMLEKSVNPVRQADVETLATAEAQVA